MPKKCSLHFIKILKNYNFYCMPRVLINMLMMITMLTTLAVCQNKGSVIMSEKNQKVRYLAEVVFGVLKLYLSALKELRLLSQVMPEGIKRIRLIKKLRAVRLVMRKYVRLCLIQIKFHMMRF